MSDMDKALQRGWVTDSGLGLDQLEALLDRYREPHRRFHTVEHVAAVVAAVGADPRATRETRLAAWFHDAVYDPTASDNEARSADLATATLADAHADRGRVAELILFTRTHQPPDGDEAAAALCDADLGILGSAPERYRRYVGQVRAEYAHVDDDGWRAGRGQFLAETLARPRIVSARNEAVEVSARRNLAAELTALGAGDGV